MFSVEDERNIRMILLILAILVINNYSILANPFIVKTHGVVNMY